MYKVLRCLIILLIAAVVSLGVTVSVQAAVTIDLDQNAGMVGDSITASGTTDAADGTTLTITYDGVTRATDVASGGIWSAQLTIPDSTFGDHTISVSGAGTASTTFTINPKITVTQPSGVLTVMGTGFGASENISVNVDGTKVNTSTITSDSKGYWSVSGLSVASGSHQFEGINDTATHAALTTFTVVSHSSIALGKSSGPVGTAVTVNGSGFVANETGITLTFDGSQVGSTARASSSGAWTMNVTIPTAAGGPHNIDAHGATTKGESVPDQTFTITPVITLKPTSASPGATITVSGTGFAASETDINATFDGESIGTSAAAAANGTWNTTFKVPAGSAGTHTIDASGSSTSAASVPDLSFKVGAGITISKSSGGAGTPVTVTGAGFAASEPDITITYDGNQVGSKVTANAAGGWTSNFVIPASPAGAHTISASGPTTAAVSVQFTSTASVSLPPNTLSGNVGSSINLTGSGFGANEAVTIIYDGQEMETVSANDQGGLTGTVTIPSSTAGSHTITIKGSTMSSNLSFKVTPSVSLDTATGYVGESVKISGSGFAANSALKFAYDGDALSNIGTVRTDANGSFTKQISIPVSEAGPHPINVQDAQNNTASIDFNISTVDLSVPNPVSPGDGSSVSFLGGATPDLRWSPIMAPNGSITYDLQIDSDPDFPHPLLIKMGLTVPHYTLSKTESLDSGTYYWRVRAVDAASNQSDWSQPLQLRSGMISLPLLIILIVVLIAILLSVIFLVILPRRRRAQQAAAGFAQAPEIVVPEVVNAEYKSFDAEAGRRGLPWRLALPQAPAQPRGGKGSRVLSTEDQARLKVIIDFARSLPLIEAGPNTEWLVDLAENVSSETASPALYSRLLKGELQVRYEPAWMRHPTFTDLQTLLEGQPILQDLDSFVDSVNHSASEALMLLQDIYRDATAEAGQDILANNGWGFISGVYSDVLTWFTGKYLREPSERDYSIKPDGKIGESPQFELSGESTTPFSGVLIQALDENAAGQLRSLHLKLRRAYRNNDRAREVVGNTTQLDVQRDRLINAFNQFNRLNP